MLKEDLELVTYSVSFETGSQLVEDFATPVGPTFRWAKRSIWKLSYARSPTRINRRVHDSGSHECLASSKPAISLLDGDTAQAVVTDTLSGTVKGV